MFKSDVALTQYSNYKIGGLARYFYIAKTPEDIVLAAQKAKKERANLFILGGGTNLLIGDEGFDGLALKPEIKKLEIEKFGNNKILVRAGAGVLVSDFLNCLISKGLSGFEWAGGLPGTVGGAIRGNAGAFGGETKDSIVEVVSLDISGKQPKIVRRSNKECQFGYRNSIFKMRDREGVIARSATTNQSKLLRSACNDAITSVPKEIIFEATFALKKGDKKAIRAAIEEKIKYRQDRHPMEYPNIGSIFKNLDIKDASKKIQKQFADKIKNDPFPVLPTAVLIANADLKGVSYGGAMVSPKHPNFIVNAGGASAEDVKKLIGLVKSTIKTKFGVGLEEEIIYV